MVRSLIGTRIRERRRAKKLSQTMLAEKAGISTSYMNLIEHNHRSIAGRTLLSIAESLEVDPKELTEGADHLVLTQLQEAANLISEKNVELNRLEEFVGRYPGWSNLCAKLYENIQQQEQRLQALSDRLGHDPFFSEAMHLMLSNVTVLHSTSDILATADEIPTAQFKRFIQNMKTESERLSDTITNLLSYFDETTSTEMQSPMLAPSKLDQFWEMHDYHLLELEKPELNPKAQIKKMMDSWNFQESGEQRQAEALVERYANVADHLPLDEFIEAAVDYLFNPVLLARKFNCDLHDVHFRLAHLPTEYDGQTLPQFGLIECDGSGGVLFRKPLKTLSLPHKSSACPLWPLYRAVSQPMQPVRAIIETPTGESFLTVSQAIWSGANDYTVPPTVKSSMVFTSDYQRFLPTHERRALPTIKVGMSCEVCPRTNCSARRSDSILEN